MPKRYYTVDEVNSILPRIISLWTQIMQVRGQVKTTYQRLESKNAAPKSEDFDPLVPGLAADVLRDRYTFRGLVEVLRSQIADLNALGCQVKDIDTGLCDWWGRSGARDVLLCWRFGEQQLAFFHDLETGVAGRRPVAELEPPQLPARTAP